MGRKTQITKEQMLRAAYEILEAEGYASVNIKTIAAKVGCSTQPISWQFGNMQGLRKELFEYAGREIFGGFMERIEGMNAVAAFFETGKIYIENACEHPNVFRFLCVDDPGDLVRESGSAFDLLGDEVIKEILMKELNTSAEVIGRIVGDVVIYAHGLAVLIMWDGFRMDKETAYSLIFAQGVRCFKEAGFDIDKYF